MGNGMNKVLEGLYVGNWRDSNDSSQLTQYGITHILSIHDTARQRLPDKQYLCILASDNEGQDLMQYFTKCNDFIHSARLNRGVVLIHCLAGMSRSVTVAVAYIMSVTALTWQEALRAVRGARHVANPNQGFQRQLQSFQSEVLSQERRRIQRKYQTPEATRLGVEDEIECRRLISVYRLVERSRDPVEGACPVGQTCPTGICNHQYRVLRRPGSSSSSLRSNNSSRSSSRSSSPVRIQRPCRTSLITNQYTDSNLTSSHRVLPRRPSAQSTRSCSRSSNSSSGIASPRSGSNTPGIASPRSGTSSPAMLSPRHWHGSSGSMNSPRSSSGMVSPRSALSTPGMLTPRSGHSSPGIMSPRDGYGSPRRRGSGTMTDLATSGQQQQSNLVSESTNATIQYNERSMRTGLTRSTNFHNLSAALEAAELPMRREEQQSQVPIDHISEVRQYPSPRRSRESNNLINRMIQSTSRRYASPDTSRNTSIPSCTSRSTSSFSSTARSTYAPSPVTTTNLRSASAAPAANTRSTYTSTSAITRLTSNIFSNGRRTPSTAQGPPVRNPPTPYTRASANRPSRTRNHRVQPQ